MRPADRFRKALVPLAASRPLLILGRYAGNCPPPPTFRPRQIDAELIKLIWVNRK